MWSTGVPGLLVHIRLGCKDLSRYSNQIVFRNVSDVEESFIALAPGQVFAAGKLLSDPVDQVVH